jgi:hypothetical protein
MADTPGTAELQADPYAVGWKNHRQRIVVDGVRVDEANCFRCGQPWPCEVAQAFEAGFQRGLEQNDGE